MIWIIFCLSFTVVSIYMSHYGCAVCFFLLSIPVWVHLRRLKEERLLDERNKSRLPKVRCGYDDICVREKEIS